MLMLSLNDFKFGTFIGRFPSDGAASMAVKGLSNKQGELIIAQKESAHKGVN